MSARGALPQLMVFSGKGDEWVQYELQVYERFRIDFVHHRPRFTGQRLQIIAQKLDERERTFWHLITEGKIEDDRTPCLRRCERIGWVRCIVEHSHCTDILAWVNFREGRKNIVIALDDFSYVVVIGDRGTFKLLLTAYPVLREHEERRLRNQFEAAKEAGGVLDLQGDPATPSTHGG
jgi:hypothetical protein